MTTPTPNPSSSGDSFRAPRTVTPLSVPALNYDRLRFPLTHDQLSSLVRGALEEDQAFNDVTTIATVLSSRRARASLVARQAGCIAGVSLALEAFRLLDPKISMRVDTEDGTRVEKGDTVIYMTGHARALLSAERTALNFMQRLSGIATLTAQVRGCGEGHAGEDPRHAQDDARVAPAREVRRARRRWREPPPRPRARGPDQGQSSQGRRRRCRRRRASRSRARAAGREDRSRVRLARSGARGHRGRRRRGARGQHAGGYDSRGGDDRARTRRRSRRQAASRSTPCARSRRRASTTSRSARSRIRRRR